MFFSLFVGQTRVFVYNMDRTYCMCCKNKHLETSQNNPMNWLNIWENKHLGSRKHVAVTIHFNFDNGRIMFDNH